MARSYSQDETIHRRLKVDRRGDYQKGEDVRALQAAVNRRLRARDQHRYQVAEDGEYGPSTARACSRTVYLLGITGPRLLRSKAGNGGHADLTCQRTIRNPGTRTLAMLRRARRRSEAVAAKAARLASGRRGALRFAKRYVGTTESPAGSNRGGPITGWQQSFGAWLVGLAWCGVFVGACLRSAGVKGVTYRIASVAFIEADARAGRGPFRGWTTDYSRVRRGDLVVIGGHGVHVEIVDRVSGGTVYTVGGNTSPGRAGSQADGGGVFERERSRGEVHGFALVRF